MSIYQTSAEDLALLMSASSGVTILSKDFSIVGIMPTPNNESEYNTKIKVSFGVGAPFSGEKTFYYDRLNLADLQHLHPFTDGRLAGSAQPGASVYFLFTVIRDGLGINFINQDLQETFAASDAGGEVIKLLADSKSPGWFGSYDLKLMSPPNISNAFYSEHAVGI